MKMNHRAWQETARIGLAEWLAAHRMCLDMRNTPSEQFALVGRHVQGNSQIGTNTSKFCSFSAFVEVELLLGPPARCPFTLFPFLEKGSLLK